MAQSGFTPIQTYRSVTASAVPLASDLVDGELAININDGKLYFKNSSGTVKLIAATLLPVANGGTGVTTSTGTGSVVLSASPTFTGAPISTTASLGTNSTVIATTAYVQAEISANIATATPSPLGTAAVGTSLLRARQDHVHAMPILDALANVTVTSNSSGEILKWSGSAWINQTLAESGIAASTTNVLAGNGLTGGGTIAADRTITLGTPSTITSSTTNSSTSGTHSHALSFSVTATDVGFTVPGSAGLYACRAWVNFNGTGVVAIRGSANVSSITDIAVGIYRVNFAVGMADAFYVANGTTCFGNASGNGNAGFVSLNFPDYTPTSSNFTIRTQNDANTALDFPYVMTSVFS
mgnify:FL=1